MAIDLAGSRLQAERERMHETTQSLEAGRQEAAELANQVAGELEVAKTRNLDLEAAEREARVEAGGLREQLASASERLAMTEARVKEIEKRADDLNRELERVHAQNAELLKVVATARNTKV